MKIRSHAQNLILKVFACLLLGLTMVQLRAQSLTSSVSGTVVDATGQPVAGAAVINSRTGKGEITDLSGKYSFSGDVAEGDVLTVSIIGYQEQKVKVLPSRSVYNVVLEEDALQLAETVVVGYGVQKKATLTGSVAAVNNSEIISTKNENVSNMLTGKVAGLRVVQTSSEPGQFAGSIDIRGFGSPLVIIDGVPRGNMSRIDPDDIESVSVLKDASAAIYGVRSGNGVILITTKKGNKKPAEVTYSGNVTWQRPSDFPNLLGAVDWMTLYNERSMHNVDNQNRIVYTDSQIEEYRNGTKHSTDWISEVFRDSAPQTQHNINVSGGNDRITYFASAGYQYQESFLQTNAINYSKYNIRSNVSAKISRNLTFDISLAGMMDKRNSPVYSSFDIVRGMWLMQPMDQVWWDEAQGQYWQPTNEGLNNPVAMMDTDLTGKNSYQSKWFQSNASLEWKVPYVEGLSVKGMFSYDFTLNDNKEYVTSYKLYRDGKEFTKNSYTADDVNYPGKISRYYYGKNAFLAQGQIAYNRTFGKHSVNALALVESVHNDGDNFYGTRYLDLPIDQVFAANKNNQQFGQSTGSGALYDYANISYVGRLQYDYANKYLAEFAFRYEGSSRYSSNKRWAFSPSVLLGYVISEEKFWKESPLAFINRFKIRGSWGRSGDDTSLSYQFMTGYNYPVSGNAGALPGGTIIDGSFVNASADKGLANKALTWYTVETWNVGFDAAAWNGLLTVSADYFRRDRDGLFSTRINSLPGIVGASLPQENLNSDFTQGFEVELGHENRLGEFVYSVKGNLAFTMSRDVYVEKAEAGNSYLNWRTNTNNRNKNIWWGYEGNGRITSWDEIYYNPVYIGRGSVMGDYEYLDWNGDGMINDLDLHPIGNNSSAPLVNYGLTLNMAWKGLDLSMLFQGASRRWVAPQEFLYQPLWADTNALSQFMDRWHPTDPSANPYDPATEWTKGTNGYTGSLPNSTSEFNVKNAAYLRLKSVELGYSLPVKWVKNVGVQNVRFYVSAYNLLTFSGLKYLDPEFNVTSSYGYNYPISKTVTLGLNLKF